MNSREAFDIKPHLTVIDSAGMVVKERGCIELIVTLRSKTTFGIDTDKIYVWDGQSAKEVAERTAQGYGAEVVEIRHPDGSLYE